MTKKERSREVRIAIDQMKFEIARELGYDYLDGSVPSKLCGYVGGRITAMLIAIGEERIKQYFAEQERGKWGK